MKSALIATAMTAFALSQILDGAIARDYDLVINNGRVIDPETGLDDIRSVGVSDGEIVKISKRPLKGETIIVATGMIVAPGFIDRNTYTLGPDLFQTRTADGVTTTFNFEEGALDVPAAYAAQEGKALINYGFSMSWGAAREAAAASEELSAQSRDLSELVLALAGIIGGGGTGKTAPSRSTRVAAPSRPSHGAAPTARTESRRKLPSQAAAPTARRISPEEILPLDEDDLSEF